ncbi:membrane bound O-acyl transferase family-domain-containing protein [Lophiotrema nucula]|uniref:Membrane bound O-acyl transferase family-domain-containing protein n=1 Tax=Lophiotrema nucula TaxID=690887 RepID=A0A6A5YIW0_9PLEO|nr:membrane bound O-acyl transferase family-domain-containing protein [Lophiotrema nucula]
MFDQQFVPLFSRLNEVTAEEMAVRVMVSIVTALSTYLLFQAIYSGSAVVMMASGLNSVESWRPLFGSFTQCTSLRGVWNQFRHQGMVTTLTVPARYITTKVFRLPRATIIQRYAYIMVVFQLSGLVHIVGDVAAGVDIKDSGVMQWFSVQALGFAIEDSVSWLWRILTGRRDDEARTWQKGLGFIWVVACFVWTMPVWTFPISRVSEGEGILPFSLIQPFIAT